MFVFFVFSVVIARSATGECFLSPADPTDCSLIGVARANFLAARSDVIRSYRSLGGVYDPVLTSCFVGVLSYVAGCERGSCENYDFDVRRDLPAGWHEERTMRFVGAKGSCKFSKAHSDEDAKL